MPEMVTGRLEYAHNVRVPGMVHGRVVRPPTVGATVASTVSDIESSVNAIPGFIKVVVKKDFVGVVCEKQWQAVQAANQVKVQWKPGPKAASAGELLRSHAHASEPRHVSRGFEDVEATLAKAAQVVRSTYLHPYHMHGSIGASCAVADVKTDSATIWSPTQGVYPQRDSCAMVLGMKPQQVKVIYARGSGCYGINGADTVSYDAALLSQAVDVPVRVQLSRKGRDGERKLRPRVRGRSTRRTRRSRQHHRVGLRELVSDSRRASWVHAAGQPDHRLSRGLPACAIRAANAGASAGRPVGEWLECRAVLRYGDSRWRRRWNRDGEMRAHAVTYR
jgi:hypothetical protein